MAGTMTEDIATILPSIESTASTKLRSCTVCRSRKVRCDKQSPCSNCRRANIPCIVASTDPTPRWARRLNQRSLSRVGSSNTPTQRGFDSSSDKVMERLRSLEELVKELRSQLEHARAAGSSIDGASSGLGSAGDSPQHQDAERQYEGSSPASESNVQKQFGRLVLQDASHSRYVSSGFWSRVEDEIEGLKVDLAEDDSFTSEDDEPFNGALVSQDSDRSPWSHHNFPFRSSTHSTTDLDSFQPLPSQIPFLLDVFSENVNHFLRIIHLPSIRNMLRESRKQGVLQLTPSTKALMFSIYYAAVTSMEEDDVMTNFGFTKNDLSLKYRFGLEKALMNADFLNSPDTVLVQSFALYLCLARRDESPRWIWMMTGLLIRMAQYLGLQRDGSHFEHLTPFEIQNRRMIWWAVCMLDLRASEDQGTDLTIASGSFDTKIPMNINESDISPDTKEVPIERSGITDMTFARIYAGITETMRQMTASVKNGASGLDDQNRRLSEIYQNFENEYFQHTKETGSIDYWVAITIARLVMAKMTLIVFLPVLFSSPEQHVSDEIRNKLLISAIEVAEYNHELNAEEKCRQWRWVYQTHTHWHAIVFLLIETSRRAWSPTVERAWVALHSPWLMPARGPINKHLRIWIPLRKLMEKARQHRDAELLRLRANPEEAAGLEHEDQGMPEPGSSGPFPKDTSVSTNLKRWRQLVGISDSPQKSTQTRQETAPAFLSKNMVNTTRPNMDLNGQYSSGDVDSTLITGTTLIENDKQQNLTSTMVNINEPFLGSSQGSGPSLNMYQAQGNSIDPEPQPWLWPYVDTSPNFFSNFDMDSFDPNMELDGEINWFDWMESAKGMDWNTRS